MGYNLITMAIKIETTHAGQTETTLEFSGRVIEVRKFMATRNMSDTLDYTDRQYVECTEALVWLGTHGHKPHSRCNDETGAPEYHISTYGDVGDLDFTQQFAWVNCSNHFVWRGEPRCTPEVDADIRDLNTDPMMWVNYIAWKSHQKANLEEAHRAREEAIAKDAALQAAKAAKVAARAKLIPVKGDKVIVVGGRKVKKGFTGVAAYVADGRVLVKQPHEWQDRKANGVWVAIDYLEKQV